LPTFQPDPETVRVLHVSDIHLNPNVWPIMRAIVEQYDVAMVIDTGDIADQGTAAESRLLTGIRTIPVPYVFIRGNHDSFVTQTAVADLPNTVVLTGEIEEVEGLRMLGDGDPRFTPDKATEPSAASVVAQGEDLAEVALADGEPVDVILVHDPSAAPPLAGAAPLVLAGHVHQRRDELLSDETRLLVQGSSGGAGLRALESEKPTPLTFTVLYFDRESRQLQARDEITLGGLGTTTAEVERIIMEQLVEETTP
jgi:predicted phosphodiesterase